MSNSGYGFKKNVYVAERNLHVWNAAVDKARRNNTSLSKVIYWFLASWVDGRISLPLEEA